MNAKPCTHCRAVKDASEFYKNKSRSDGLQSWCKSCSSSRTKERRIGQRQEMLESLGGSCVVCDYSGPALQIDHIDGDAVNERSPGTTGYSTFTLYNAFVKNPHRFQLLCANCNWEKRFALDETR